MTLEFRSWKRFPTFGNTFAFYNVLCVMDFTSCDTYVGIIFWFRNNNHFTCVNLKVPTGRFFHDFKNISFPIKDKTLFPKFPEPSAISLIGGCLSNQ